MELDELVDYNERDRMQLFDEIRKRAEAEEYARIEVEEAKLTAAFSFPHSGPVESCSLRDDESQITEMRGEFVDAIQEDNLKNASALSKELLVLSPNHPAVEEFAEQTGPSHQRLDAKRSEKDKEQSEQHVAVLLQTANEKYQSEKYEQALDDLQQLLEVDPHNDEGLALYADVKKAKALTDRLQEEARHKDEEEQAALQSFAISPRKQKEEVPEAELNIANTVDLPEPTAKVPVVEESKPSSHPSFKKRWIWVAMSLLIALGIVAGYVVYENFKEKIFIKRTGVLILPATTTNSAEYIADGLTEDLIAHLSHVRALTVFTPNAAFNLRKVSPAEAAKILGAEYYLEWKIDQSGNETGVALSLFDASSGERILEQSYKLSRTELAGFCSTVVPEFADALSVDANNFVATYKPLTTNGEAYDLYLLGRYLLNHRELASLDSVATVFDLARRSDPTFPYSEAALGWVEVLTHEASADTVLSHIEAANRHLQRAMNLGARNADVYRLWGMVEYYRANYTNALERLEHAVALAPSDAEAYRRLAIVYMRTGKADDAVLAARQAVVCDPFHSRSRTMLAMLLMITGENASAAVEFETNLRHQSVSPENISDEYLALLVAMNRHEPALDILGGRVRLNPKDFIAQYDLGRMYQLAGKPKADWEKVFQLAMTNIADSLAVSPSDALVYSYRGLVQTRLGLFGAGAKSNARALELAPSDATILFNSARVFALQRSQSAKALSYVAKAVEQRFSLSYLLDLDLLGLRNDARLMTVAWKK